ncbi:PREDICTED: uncharacterized protein LOC106100388 [Papilio polytes]|uniref:uncharacterized protein LOC106100388 n=1 Tax=Papilio polytes TaxID=76194 RepID=UPI0006767788|nr:PREDICTED: uncharacterized protein LOC106100388 [Papilio polytes]
MGKSTLVDGDNNPTSAESDPAKLLEAALLQMDGIIAEAGGAAAGATTPSGPGRVARARALELAQQLASSLQHAIPPPPRPDFTTASAILRWLQQNNNSVALNDAEDRVRRLEADKESLQLQVQVLSEQIAAQTEKMVDLERSLNDTRQKLDDTEQRLQKEMLSRSSLETQKLELLSKLSEVRLRVVERGVLERSPPPDAAPLPRPAPPRTPPANYGRQIERNTHLYSSLPRSSVLTSEARVAFGKQNNMVVARGRGHSVPNLAEKEETVPRGSPSPSLREVRARYQPLTATTKYKVPKKSQFSLKRKKSREELDLGELVCPLREDASGDLAPPMMRAKSVAVVESGVSPPRDDSRAH